jgi:16S rRNA (cytosine1402-N4)-methyltransferase
VPPLAGGCGEGQAQVTSPHVPVLLDEVIAALDPQPDEVMVDATFGAGGYSQALLERGARVYAFDRDPDAIYEGGYLEAHYQGRLTLHPQRFSAIVEQMRRMGVPSVDAFVMDVGVSSMQLDQAERGFAFSADGPLDMRMSREGESAADFLNSAREEDIADVLYRYGEERQSRRVARAIVAARPLDTTGDLARVVRKALGYRANLQKGGAPKDPATRTFQAVRIHVNAELEELEAGLRAAETLLREGGRLAVVTFHSLEDRIVKRFLREAAGAHAGTSRHLPERKAVPPAAFARVSRAIRSSEAEIARNPRARSATLRAAVRTAAPAREAAA